MLRGPLEGAVNKALRPPGLGDTNKNCVPTQADGTREPFLFSICVPHHNVKPWHHSLTGRFTIHPPNPQESRALSVSVCPEHCSPEQQPAYRKCSTIRSYTNDDEKKERLERMEGGRRKALRVQESKTWPCCSGPSLVPYLKGPLQGLLVRGNLVHFVLVVRVPLGKRPHSLYLCPQIETLFLQAL